MTGTKPSDWERLMASDEPLDPALEPYMDETDFGPMLKHPLVYSIIPHPAMVNFQYVQKTRALEQAKAEQDWHSVVWLHERPYRLEALLGIADQMDDEDYWATVINIWIDSENIFEHLDDWMTLFESDRPGRQIMMSDEERDALAAMDEPIIVYRGFTDFEGEEEEFDSRVDGLAWTVDLERATWFAKRYAYKGRSQVAKGLVHHQDVVGYFTGRNESEIVVKDLGSVRVTEYIDETDETEEAAP